MAPTFGEELKRFALSIDTVDDEIGKEFFGLFTDFLVRKCKIKYFHIMTDSGKFEGNPLLQVPEVGGAFWSSARRPDSVRIRSDSEEESSRYMAQSTYVYETEKPIWVTGNGKPLNEVEHYNEAWSQSDTLPNYFSDEKMDVRTSIVIPLKSRHRTFGIVCIESAEELKFNEEASFEFKRFAEAAGTVLSVRETCKEQHQNTDAALDELKDLAHQRWPSFLKVPKVFVAHPDDADRGLVDAILATTNEFASKLEVVHWQSEKKAGDVMTTMREHIDESRFGICYFSEKEKRPNSEELSFRDNPNVLFEAGMMQALIGNSAVQLTAWIPIREYVSTPKEPPFDVAQQNMIIVKRSKSGELNVPQFTNELRDRIVNIIGIKPELNEN